MTDLDLADKALIALYLLTGLLLPVGVLLFRSARRPENYERGGRVMSEGYGLLDVFGIGVLWVIFSALALLPIFAAPPASVDITPGAILGSSAALGVVGVLPFALVLGRGQILERFGLYEIHWKRVILSTFLGLISIYAVVAAINLAGFPRFLESVFGELDLQEAVRMLAEAKDKNVKIAMVISAVILAPLIEEVIFRGYIYPAMKQLTHTVFAIVFSSLFFSLVHGNVLNSLSLFVVGAALAIVYEKSGSLVAPIALHAVFNGISVCAILFYPEAVLNQ